jgi:DNA repair exonuclease SbcCD nuclease subunit
LPLQNVPDFDPASWRINMAHGHWVQGEADEERAYRSFTADIDGQRADYLALGHWDVFTEVRSSAPAYYSGSPLYARSVNMVELSESEGLRVTRLPVEC